jgi:hypothetical protein
MRSSPTTSRSSAEQNQNPHKIVRELDAKMEAGEREYCEART